MAADGGGTLIKPRSIMLAAMLVKRSIRPQWRTCAPSLASVGGVRWSKAWSKAKKKGRHNQHSNNPHMPATKKQEWWGYLAEPAKMKRVLSMCDQWFGKKTLPRDDIFMLIMSIHNGWMPVSELLKLPRMQDWVEETTVVLALMSVDKYETSDLESGSPLFRPKSFGQAWREAARNRVVRDAQSPDDLETDDDDTNDMREGYLRMKAAIKIWIKMETDGERKRAAAVAIAPAAKTKKKALPHFTFDGTVTVVKSPEHAASVCASLLRASESPNGATSSTESTITDPNAASPAFAIGFDVEFCTLEYDLRMLPAVLTLASIDHVWLIWLDKFNSHGYGLLSTCRPLASMLADPNVLKIGVGSRADAKKLLEWTPARQAAALEPIRGVIDLNSLDLSSMGDGADSDAFSIPTERSLSGWCEAVLGRKLPKRKHTGKKGSKASKKAHWRAPHLTADMKEYAASDAAAGLGVWQALMKSAQGDAARIRLLESAAREVQSPGRLDSLPDEDADEPRALF